MSLSILFAFREDLPGPRTRTWSLVRRMLERDLPEAEIVVGTDEGLPFNKSRALNRAAAQATGSILAISDTDTWAPVEGLREAAELLEAHPRRWIKPWNRKCRLDEETTERVLVEDETWDGRVPRRARYEGGMAGINAYWASPPIVVTREMYERVRMDERIEGWGSEDGCFAFALKAFYGHSRVLRYDAVHLFHPRDGKIGKALWEGQESAAPNFAMYERYRRVSRDPGGMERLLAERDEALASSA